MGALAIAIQLLDLLPSVITASEAVISAITSTSTALKQMQAENRDPTDAEWSAVNAAIIALQNEIIAALNARLAAAAGAGNVPTAEPETLATPAA